MRRAGRSFGFRLAVAFAGVGLAAAAVTALLVNLSFERRFTGYLEEQQGGRARQLVAALAGSYERMGGWDTRDLDDLAAFALMDGGEVRLLDAAGEVVWQPASVPGAAGMAEMHRRMMGDGPIGSEQRIPVEVGGATVGTVVLRLPRAGLLPQDVEFRDSINRLLLYGGLAAGGLALLLGVFLARMATRPARELTRAARRLAAGEHGVRASHDAPDEFGEMARAFNAMADIVEEEDRLRRAFAADVAHELRTPLAILRTHLEAMQDGIVPTGAIELGSLHEEVLRLSRVVADLEILASADAASFSLDRRAVDLREVVGASIAGFADGFAREWIAVEATLEPAVAEVDPIRVRQILD
ncbi:MAG: HAMP domain-containing protein, partial [Actinobacteria bacterium]|nr:HAMP domain-containing protein [Actinomycetota bacterium]